MEKFRSGEKVRWSSEGVGGGGGGEAGGRKEVGGRGDS